MTNWMSRLVCGLVLMFGLATAGYAQLDTGTITGTVSDESKAVVGNATVTVRNVRTGLTRTTQTDSEGRFRFSSLPIGSYELTVEATGQAKYVQQGIELLVNQVAVLEIGLKVAATQEVVTVTGDASILNTTNAEVSTRFDSKRLMNLPFATNGNVYNILLSVPGVSQLASGQTGFANGISFSVNGGRVRSNNFMVDGQDLNDPSVAGVQQPLNNPDLIQEVRIITSQFAPEFGRNSGSVVNMITKSGSNEFHGSLFWFNNNNALNARSNLDKRAGRREAPFRIENRIGGSLGGPIWRNKTFFFGTLQRWTDRALGSGFTLNGAPTEEGRQVLRAAAGDRPQVAALLRFLPPAQAPIGRSESFTIGNQTFTVPLGSLTGSASQKFDNWQWSSRIDHQFDERNRISGSFLFNDQLSSGFGQVTPPGLTTRVKSRQQALNLTWTHIFSPRWINEFRAAYNRFNSVTNASDPSSQEIPSIEINSLGMLGFNAAPSRTAIGLAVNLPQARTNNTYQFQDVMTYTAGNHTMKFGVEVTNRDVRSFFFPTIRGRLQYTTLQNFVNDVAQIAQINLPLRGGQAIQYYDFTDVFAFWQDEWRIRPNFTITYGLRYETPGNPMENLYRLNDRIVAANGNDPNFRLQERPGRDTNNFQPRFGFNWNPRTQADGIWGAITGGDKLVVRGGYARTFDASFLNIALNVGTASPFAATVNLPSSGAFAALRAVQPFSGNPRLLAATIVAPDFRSPFSEQFSLEVQRELTRDVVMRVGYVGTKGTALFQTIDGNPNRPRTTPPTPTDPNVRLDPTRGPVRLRANAASSIYHSLQISVDKRLSRDFSAGVHYTWSKFIDEASEIFNPSTGEIALPQDSFNRRADRAVSSYDRTHRLTGNFVYEFPFFKTQQGVVGRLLGGWQTSGFVTFQSGAPFTVLNGSDPLQSLAGINALVGDPIRPNLNTTRNLSRMTVAEILRAGGASLFAPLRPGQRVGDAGRNILRADGIGNVDLSIAKNTRIVEGHNIQLRVDFFNMTNTRNFGIPNAIRTSAAFLNQWGTDGGNRRIVFALRYSF